MKHIRGQSIAEADREVRQFVIRIAASLGDVIPLSGLYLSGSLATGSFHRDRSDINILAVVSEPLTPQQHQAAARAIARLSDSRPTLRDVQIGIITAATARDVPSPVPLELRYAGGFAKERTSYAFAAEMFETRERGVALVGPAPDRAFAPVPWYAFIEALRTAFVLPQEEIDANPSLAVLNACRVLHGAVSKRMSAVNKDEAALWALEALPERYRSAIRDALLVYRGVKSHEDVVFATGEIEALNAYVMQRAKPAFDRARDFGE